MEDAADLAPADVALLSAEGVSVSFGPVRALISASVQVGPGEIVALAGENGAGKSTLVRCIAGDLAPGAGRILIDDQRLPADPIAAARHGVAVVWQDLALCDNLDVAANFLLGAETGRLMRSETRLHRAAGQMLSQLKIPFADTTRNVRTLSSPERQLLAVARAIRDRPRLLVLDEPTANLGLGWSMQVEELTRRLRDDGAGVLLVTHDIEQMFRLADRIVILRHGRVAAELKPAQSYPDDVVALMSGQEVDVSARRQLDRLQGLVDRLASTDPSSGLQLILSVLSSALGIDRVCIHLLEDGRLRLAGMLGLNPELALAWARLPLGAAGGPVGEAAASARPVIDIDARVGPRWSALREVASAAGVASSWSVPVVGASGLTGVITVLRDRVGRPTRDELDLAALYAGHAAGALEREQAERAQQEAVTLRRSQELQQAFLSRLSHELRTPLTAIRGYASSLLAADVVWDDDSQRRFIGRIAGESDRLGRLVDDLLDFSAIQADILRLNLDWCDLGLVIDAAVACLPPEGAAAVTVLVAPDIPVIWADHDRLEQVLVNLMDNAFRHNDPGTAIEVSAERAGPHSVEVIVADDGRGLPPEVAADPFRAGRDKRGPTAGAGLGLSIAKGIVDAHGGAVTLDRPPRGTSFRVRLAIEAPAAEAGAHLGADAGVGHAGA